MIKAALGRTTRLKTTRLAAAIFRAPLIAAAVVVAARVVSARLALRRSVFRRRQIAAAHAWALRSTSAVASTTAAPTATTTAVTTPVCTAIGTTAITLAGSVAATAGAWRVVLRRIVMGRKILGCGGVRIRLALLRVMSIVVYFGSVGTERFVGTGMVFYDPGLLVVRKRIVVRRFLMRCFVLKGFVGDFFALSFVGVPVLMLMRGSGVSQRFAGQ
jgi:hypothetical protein